jgi:hypothetical protein
MHSLSERQVAADGIGITCYSLRSGASDIS